MPVRHQTITGEEVNTHLGPVRIDARGLVTNIQEITGGEAALLEIPGFQSADLFEIEGYQLGDVIVDVKPTSTVPERLFTDEEYWEVIQELETDADNLNSEGFVEINILTKALRDRRMPVLSGAKRKEIALANREQPTLPVKNG